MSKLIPKLLLAIPIISLGWSVKSSYPVHAQIIHSFKAIASDHQSHPNQIFTSVKPVEIHPLNPKIAPFRIDPNIKNLKFQIQITHVINAHQVYYGVLFDHHPAWFVADPHMIINADYTNHDLNQLIERVQIIKPVYVYPTPGRSQPRIKLLKPDRIVKVTEILAAPNHTSHWFRISEYQYITANKHFVKLLK